MTVVAWCFSSDPVVGARPPHSGWRTLSNCCASCSGEDLDNGRTEEKRGDTVLASFGIGSSTASSLDSGAFHVSDSLGGKKDSPSMLYALYSFIIVSVRVADRNAGMEGKPCIHDEAASSGHESIGETCACSPCRFCKCSFSCFHSFSLPGCTCSPAQWGWGCRPLWPSSLSRLHGVPSHETTVCVEGFSSVVNGKCEENEESNEVKIVVLPDPKFPQNKHTGIGGGGGGKEKEEENASSSREASIMGIVGKD